MADITIRLVSNPKSGKRDIYIDYDSEDDALPIEHEKDHRQIVEQLLGQGILDPDDVGQIKVQRVQGEGKAEQQTEQQNEREAASQKG